jgi:hypothetical protein
MSDTSIENFFSNLCWCIFYAVISIPLYWFFFTFIAEPFFNVWVVYLLKGIWWLSFLGFFINEEEGYSRDVYIVEQNGTKETIVVKKLLP